MLSAKTQPSQEASTIASSPAESRTAAATASTQASEATAAAAAAATAMRTPPPPPPDTPLAVRRAAVSERVAREVLNFMAAIERGELTAVGLPEVPGAAMFPEVGLGVGVGGGDGGGGIAGRSAPAQERVVEDLPRIQVS